MTKRSTFLADAGAAVAASATAAAMPSMLFAQSAKPNVLLVHGALSDASVWRLVIPILQAAGNRVVGVQNPLTSLADDVANTKNQLARLSGPTVLVGHSYGGCVITSAARDAVNVKSLVFVTALAPDEGSRPAICLADIPRRREITSCPAAFRVSSLRIRPSLPPTLPPISSPPMPRCLQLRNGPPQRLPQRQNSVLRPGNRCPHSMRSRPKIRYCSQRCSDFSRRA